MSLVLAAVASALATLQSPMSWEGTAEVYPPGGAIKIAVRTRIDAHGNVVSESWPVDVGEARGMHRMSLDSHGGTTEVGGKRSPMPAAMWIEERAQYGFYQQLQLASAKAPAMARRGLRTVGVSGPATTRFQINRSGSLVGAANSVSVDGSPTPQTFSFDGFWRSHGVIFPRHMEIFRGGRPYFTLDVTRFHGG